MNLVQKFRPLKPHLNQFCNLTKMYTCVLRAVRIVEATEWVQSSFKRLEF